MFISVYAVDGFLNYFVQPKIKKKNECPRSMFIKLSDQQYLLLQWISLMFCCRSGGKREG